MANFQYWEGLRSDVSAMISEVGNSTLIKVPTMVTDAYGNQTDITYKEYYESIWIRPLGEVMQIENIGQMNYEDLRFEVGFNTKVINDTIIIYQDKEYIVVSIDKPDITASTTHLVGMAKRKLA